MRIESLHIRGFGCLVDRRYEFPTDGEYLIVENNEQGKSTLAAAILAGLCGMPSRRAANEVIKLKDVYKPWNTNDYGLEMVIRLSNNARLRIGRDFARDQFVVIDVDTGQDISRKYEQDLTSQLLNLPREDYQRVAFITGKEAHQFKPSTELRAKLESIVEGSSGNTSAEAAIEQLADPSVSFEDKTIKIKTAIKRINDVISEKSFRITQLDDEMSKAEEQWQRLEELKSGRDEMQTKLARLDTEFHAARLMELRRQIAAAENIARDNDAVERELAELEKYASFPAERASILTKSKTLREELQSQITEIKVEVTRHNTTADEIRPRLAALNNFATATEHDLSQLSACEALVASNEEAVASCQADINDKRPSSGNMTSWAFIILGVISVGLMILRIIPPIVSIPLTILSTAIAAWMFYKTQGASAGAVAKLDGAISQLTSSQERAVRLLSSLGLQPPAKDGILEATRRAKKSLSDYIADRDSLADTEQRIAEQERKVREAERRISDETGVIHSILQDAGIDAAVPIQEAIVQFGEFERKYRRYRELKDSLRIVQKQQLPQDELEKLKSEEAQAAAQAGVDAPVTQRTTSEVDNERARLRIDMDNTLGKIAELEKSVGGTVDRYRSEYATLRESVSDLQRELKKITNFDEALEVAGNVMREVAQNTRRKWATELNNRASHILPHLNPNYDSILFDESLNFTVRHIPDGRIIQKNEIDANLSTGAKDQVYLAVRLACCEALSALGESMPIILDDPFIAYDDDRFRSGYAYLKDQLALNQQVIVLSCHKTRHEHLT